MSSNNICDVIHFGSLNGPWNLLSPHCVLPFNIEGKRFYSLDHYLLFRKASLFCDHLVQSELLTASIPGDLERLDSQIEILDQELWKRNLHHFLLAGVMVQIMKYPKMRDMLLETGDSYLLYISSDSTLGSGTDENTSDSFSFTGQNTIGSVLMEARNSLISCITQ